MCASSSCAFPGKLANASCFPLSICLYKYAPPIYLPMLPILATSPNFWLVPCEMSHASSPSCSPSDSGGENSRQLSTASLPGVFSASPSSSLCSSPSQEFGGFMCLCIATVAGHEAAVSSVVPAGDYLYTASHSSEVRVWGQPDLSQLCDQLGCSNGQGSVKAILVAGDRVFVAHQDHKIRVWSRGRRASAAKRQATGGGAHRLVATLPTKGDCFIKGLSQDNYVQVRRHHKKLWIQHADTISALAIGRRNKLLYSGSWDKTVKVWRLSDLRCVESIRAHDDALNALVVSEREGFLYTASADGKVKVWRKEPNVKKHSLMATLEGLNKLAAVNALALSGNGELLFSAGSDGAISVWGKGKGEQHISLLRSTLQGCHRLPILCLCAATTQAGDLLLSGSADKTVRAWRISAGDGRHQYQLSCVGVLQGHRGPVKSISVASTNDQLVVGGGCLVYTGSADKSIKVWWLSSS